MKKSAFKLILFLLVSGSLIPKSVFAAQDMRSFLKTCAVGTGAGALIGTMSLVLTNKPSENLNNIAKGASLGLYAGIIYGLTDDGGRSTVVPSVANPLIRDEAKNETKPVLIIVAPKFDQQKNMGAEFLITTSF